MANQPGKHCDLCDLPEAHCVHGLNKRQARAQRKKASAQKKPGTPASRRPAQTKATRPSTQAKDGRKMCAECGKRHRYGRYRLCLQCGLATGFKLCGKCGRYFQPSTTAPRRKKATCANCRSARGKGSVWVTGSAGSPGLGKRR